jgi:hypothetical protein
MSTRAGKHSGSRKAPRAARPRKQINPRAAVHAVGIVFCVAAWLYLVFAAIDFGSSARSGRGIAWLFLLVACVGAACCLFAGLMLGTRLLVALGIVNPPIPAPVDVPVEAAPVLERVPGGKRALR